MVEIKLDEASQRRFKGFAASFVGEDAEAKAMQTLLDAYDQHVSLVKAVAELNAKFGVARSRYH